MINRKPFLVHVFGCGVLLFDAQGRITFANESARRILGLGGEPCVDPAWRILTAEGQPLPSAQHPFTRLLQGEKIDGEEFRFELADGSRRILALNGSALTGSRGELEGGVLDFNDITEKNRAQELILQAKEKLELSEARLRALIGSIDEIVFEFDAEGVYLNIWTANEELLLRPRQELLGRPVDVVIGEPLGGEFRTRLQRVLRTGIPETFEYPLEVLGGRRCFLARLAPIPPTGEAPPTLAFLARDITERKRMEEELRASESRFHQSLKKIQLAALILDRSGRVLFCNDFLLRLAGWPRQEVEGHDWFEVTQPADNRQQARESWIAAVCAGDLTGYHEEELVDRDGGRRLIGWNTILVRDRPGKITSCASIGEDITERRRAEEILRRSDQMKNEFISIAAHELRTPLTSILGYAELLLQPEQFGAFTPAQRREFLLEIYDKGAVLAEIVNELLDLTRIESGQPIPLELSPCSLDEILQKEVHNYQLHYAGHRFALTLAESCPVDILIDRHKMEQVMENLLSNAVKYSPSGSLIQVTGRRQGDDYLVEVTDEGIGMHAEQVARMFDKFYRADSSDTAASGLGLGMSIVRGIIEAHGGEIWVNSNPGRGTKVSFRLPVGGAQRRPAGA